MPTRMLTLHLDPSDATLPAVRARLNLASDEIDPNFGVVAIDPKQHLYAVMVDEAVARRVEGSPDVKGTFSNPKIEPFDTPKRRGDDE